MSTDAFIAAKKLMRDRHWRSSTSRFYYAAYAAITADLAGTITFARGWNNPSHETLPMLIDRNMPALARALRRQLKTAIRQLYDARTDADYFPERSVEQDVALRSLRQSSFILSIMRISHDHQ